jgi:putative dehydrogenase|tara:strand:+ start:508 stop:1398 length:891 start_codon:yes stop_codon:yes gene_type:complete
MKNIGVIGLGNMGIGIASNLLKNGFQVWGYDVSHERLNIFEEMGGSLAKIKDFAPECDAIFIMVMNGDQVKEALFGGQGLSQFMQRGATVIVTATIHASEIIEMASQLEDFGINLIDSPVSGGKSGADNGTLTLMAAGEKVVYDKCLPILQAVGKDIYHVGEEIGLGQKTKGALQALIGSSFTAIFESLVLGVKAGVEAEVLYEVFSTSGVSSNLFKNAATLIMERKFKDTGSHIGTMYKDLGITLQLARDNDVAMFTTAAAYELFQSGKALFPEEDNWAIVKLLEQIAKVEVKAK